MLLCKTYFTHLVILILKHFLYRWVYIYSLWSGSANHIKTSKIYINMSVYEENNHPK